MLWHALSNSSRTAHFMSNLRGFLLTVCFAFFLSKNVNWKYKQLMATKVCITFHSVYQVCDSIVQSNGKEFRNKMSSPSL